MNIDDLQHKSLAYRRHILHMIHHAGAGHTGGSLSCIDILTVLYHRVMNLTPFNWNDPQRDHYIHSKGHSVEALYAVLAGCGFFETSELEHMETLGSHFVGHPTRSVPGIEHNTGGLGHGLAVAAGLALAARLDSLPSRVFVLLGDGELDEGSNWEAMLAAAHYRLDNLIIILDRNHLQISGKTEDVLRLEPLEQKFNAFGMATRHIDGNSIAALVHTLESLPFEPGKPSLLIAETVKGKGVSFIEHNPGWHHHVPTDAELSAALAELALAEEALHVS